MSESSGLSAIKARFEGAQTKFENSPSPGPKPGITTKPKVLTKYGGGGSLNICGAGDKKEGNIPSALKPKSAINTENEKAQDKPSETSSNGPIKKRDSKVNIPEAFRQKTDAPPLETKPKPGVKPKWGSDSNNNAKVNGIPPVKNKEIIENALSQKKFGAAGSAKPSNSTQSPTGNVSPRGKTADTNIPKTESDSPKQKSPRGVGTGIDVLAKVAAMSGNSNADFKAKLRHVEPTKNSPNAGPVSPLKPVLRKGSAGDSNDVPWRRNLKSAKLREKTKSVRTVIRVIDGKKFLKVDESCLGEDSPPDKPDKMDCDIDVEALEQEYKEAIDSIDTTEKVQHGWTEVEETYDDCGNLQSQSTRAVSLIEPMTEDEELSEISWEQAGFTGLPESSEELPAPPPDMLDEQETYDDVGVAEQVPPEEEGLEQDEMYEELPEEPLPETSSEPPPPPVGPKPPEVPPTPLPTKTQNTERSESESDNKETAEQILDAKEQKRLEKERKKREKEEKKILENKEKELKKLLKVLGHKVTAEVLTTSVGKGKVKQNAKGKEKTGELAVTEGEEVDIIRMVDNPQGKWLVRILSSQKVGYCDEKNIEFMKGGQKSSTSVAPAEEEQETYEDVDGAEDLEQDEIYEECN